MIKPNWVLQFRDLPEIPLCKRWIEGQQGTPEQYVFFKLLKRQRISMEEEQTLRDAISFYKLVIPLLRNVDFNTFSKDDFENFKGYFNYIFNHLLLSENKLWCGSTYRIVKNFELLKEEKSIPNTSFLKYPPLDIVKQSAKYNRANTPDFNLFYGADSINSALMETKPKKNEMITVSVWNNKNPDKRILSYPISFGKEAIAVNPDVKKGYDAFQEKKEVNHPLLMEFMEVVLDFLGEEFSKQVTNHLDYFYSVIYSERIFENQELASKCEAIIYPSIQNKYKYENLAIRPEFLDKQFYLALILEMVVEETYYDKDIHYKHPTEISYIKPYYVKEPKQISEDGTIIW